MLFLASNQQCQSTENFLFDMLMPAIAESVWRRRRRRRQVEAGPEEFVQDAARHEEIQPALVAATKESPRFSLVKTQEALMPAANVDDLVADDVTKEVGKESLTQVELDKAAAELPKPSLVSIQEQVSISRIR